MSSDIARIPNARHRTPGFTLIEAVISVVLVGVLLVAAINTLGATAVSKRNIEHQALGYPLAADLMTEILNQAYEEPVDTVNFGRESSESGGDRTDWDDIDDYEGWSATPPEGKDGAPLDGYDQWTRSVEIAFVQTASLNNEVGVNTGVKRITVTASFNGVPAAELVAIRTQAWPKAK
ncbi:MAG: prepilin-type N-terminal cleavage/methylation domain-containing protein [Planctomycetes bacterium]|nr:prepilin-type N-terminal cleavage/methylation domain-containing protein [Planctomycetota bacterium]